MTHSICSPVVTSGGAMCRRLPDTMGHNPDAFRAAPSAPKPSVCCRTNGSPELPSEYRAPPTGGDSNALGYKLLKGPFYLAYETVLDLFGLFFVIGRGMALYRRFSSGSATAN